MDDWDDDLELDRGDRLAEFVELWTTGNAEALWKALILRQSLSGALPFEALGSIQFSVLDQAADGQGRSAASKRVAQ